MKLKLIFETIKQINTPEFKKWFGKSKAIDSSGNPMTFYHGTGANFDEFKVGSKGAIFFSVNTKSSDLFSVGHLKRDFNGSPTTYPVYLKVEKPYYIGKTKDSEMVSQYFKYYFNNKGNYLNKTQRNDILKDMFTNFEKQLFTLGQVIEDTKDFIIKYGYDGIVAPLKDDDILWAVFNPNQIKSSIGNNGEFNINSNSIVERI